MSKDYKKALDMYNKKKLSKALEYCDIGISRDLKNSKLLNLNGLILYLRGDLEGAIALWKINKDYNNDSVSKAYVRDSEEDKKRLRLYNEAQEAIKRLDINYALELLGKCKESDFNSIKVNNAQAICYYRKGEFDIANAYATKSLEIDKENKETIELKKQIDEYTKSNKGNKYKYIVLILLILVGVITFITIRTNNLSFSNIYRITNNDNKETDTVAEKNTLSNENAKAQEKAADEASNNNINEKDKQVEVKELTEEDLKINYKKASTFYDEGKYSEALQMLKASYVGAGNSHLKDDILHLLASTNEKLNLKEEAINSLEEFIKLFPKGSYTEEAYYKLALLNKDINLEKSKKYANMLVSQYPKSIYNNNKIKDIISK